MHEIETIEQTNQDLTKKLEDEHKRRVNLSHQLQISQEMIGILQRSMSNKLDEVSESDKSESSDSN